MLCLSEFYRCQVTSNHNQGAYRDGKENRYHCNPGHYKTDAITFIKFN
jgi:hypothetical protein